MSVVDPQTVVAGLVAAARDTLAGIVAGEGLSVESGDEFVACQSFHARICQVSHVV